MSRERPIAGAFAGALVVALTATMAVSAMTGPAAATASPSDLVAVDAAAAGWTVTLVTGDRVTAVGEHGYAVDRGPGRDDITFLTRRVGDEQFVVPSDALPLLSEGRLDRRLFNVTLLRDFGYDDRRADLPVMVAGVDQVPMLSADSDEGHRSLSTIDAVAVRLDKAETGQFWADLTGPGTLSTGVSRVWLDGLRQPLLSESVSQVGAPVAWELGRDGSGVTVAVLDTGIDADHPDLADRVIGAANFTEGEEDGRDLLGHGTHVAGIVAGGGQASDGEFVGVAPGAKLLDGKVCVEYGCTESWILAGMEWAAEQGADVVNLSLGGDASPDGDPLEAAVDTLTEEYGTLFVVAAGNDGGDRLVSSPATADAALAVGAVDRADNLAPFSSRGPRPDGGLKPDLTAPGVEIVSANSADALYGPAGEAYVAASGTSMAAPHVAGAAAILRQEFPEWSPAQVISALMASASPRPELSGFAEGAGRLAVGRALSQQVTAEPASVSFGRQSWPHGDNEPLVRSVSYRNDGAEEVALSLSLSAVGPDGQPAPAGFFAVDVTSVVVPAGGEAVVTVTADTSVGELDGLFGGQLIATGSGGVSVSTPFGVDREPESYDVTIVHTGRDGHPADGWTTLWRLDEYEVVDVFGPGATTVRVPAGEYTLGGVVAGAGEESLLVQPAVSVDRDQTIAVDARLAEPISVSVPRPDAEAVQAVVAAELVTDQSGFVASLVGAGFDGLFSGQLGGSDLVSGFTSTVGGTWARPGPDGDFHDSPYSYDLAWYAEGRMITGFDRTVRRRDLAVIKADHARHVPGAQAAKASLASLPGVAGAAWVAVLPANLPFQRLEYHNTDGGVHWSKRFEEVVVSDDGFLDPVAFVESRPTAYQPGQQYQERWNQAVFGPAFRGEAPRFYRQGDDLALWPTVHGDGAGRGGQSLATGDAVLYRNGEVIAEFPGQPGGMLSVPAESAEFRMEVSAQRDERFPLSTATEVAWTFESARPDGAELVVLPVSVVRFSPELDQHNTAPVGRPWRVPVAVVSQPGSAAGELVELSVAASFDDGRTWRELPVKSGSGGQHVVVPHPAEAGFVSLRAVAVDSDGNSVEQTIIRAYAIG